MATLISLTKVGIFDEFQSRVSVTSETTRLTIENVSTIETDASGAVVMFKEPQLIDGVKCTGLVVTQSPATIQSLFDAENNTVNAVVEITASVAITIPSVDTMFAITNDADTALTLANPTAGTHDGLELTFMSTTANAHTVSNASGAGFNSGGALQDVATFDASTGSNLVVKAYNGKWYIVNKTGVTLG